MNEEQGFGLRAEQRYQGAGKKAPGGGLAKGVGTIVLGLVIIGGGLGGAGYWLYNQGQPAQEEGKLPILLPDPLPIKLRPDDPGGMEVPHRDTTIYEQLDSNQPEDQVVLQELPDMPKVPDVIPSPDNTGEPAVIEQTPEAEIVANAAQIGSGKDVNASAKTPAETAIVAPSDAEKAIAVAKAKEQATAPAATSASGISEKDFRIQLASVRDTSGAEAEWKRLSYKNKDLLGSLQMYLKRADLGDKGVFYRLQAGPLPDAAAAETLCRNLKQRNVGCLIVRP
ncbi:Sporulation related domain-containing protein [Thalassospira xiamenensis M-5 = DSM 17429]|uniref:Protein TonB n=1 Tax=Thalassospira xiamenensis M-5 = DSM 17429 TaxID=1123366 RepID=A0AB72UCE6_9PROT|nr:SPOR domain-containing protein [Thalassospira xiamenensis]AJD52010.1 protein TonB [Thalassospira xiamenensis M-5 = DSM 17429]SIS93256.1 Sporulation related domain-containing protein [Thalassospira xiamenensis M-5 = DSM 17429]